LTLPGLLQWSLSGFPSTLAVLSSESMAKLNQENSWKLFTQCLTPPWVLNLDSCLSLL
jgi:hypothetical protein